MNEFKFVELIRPYRSLFAGTIIVNITFSLSGLVLPYMLKIAIDRILPNADYELFTILCACMLIVYAIRCIMRYISGYMGTYTTIRMLLDMRNRIFRHLQSLSLRFYEEYRTGKLISNVISDVSLLQQLANLCISMTEQIFTAVTIAVLLFFISPQLALLVICLLPLHILNFAHFKKILRQDALSLRERMSEISATLSENINGIRIVKSFARERSACRHFFETMRPTMDLHLHMNHNNCLCWAVFDVIAVLTYLMVIGYSISLVKSGQITLGDFAAFYSYVGVLMGPINALSGSAVIISQGLAGATRIGRLLSVIPEIREDDTPVVAERLNGHIVFDHVDFQYKDTPVLKDFSLEIKPGQKVAFVGPSGCGKSTASNLVLRFYDVCGGALTVDGIDVRRYSLESYHNNIGVVLQEPFLFSGTIRDNIAYAKKDATFAEVERAARLANVASFVERLPKKYDTVIGENGASLSGGQKQRLAIARAILKDPAILILDEATSALDTVSEVLVQQALDTVMSGRTTIIIAHRLSTIRNADKIVVMNAGKIMQCGTHDELMETDGMYKELYTTQLKNSGANPS